jgi:OOP family OmpA-OmpF porin
VSLSTSDRISTSGGSFASYRPQTRHVVAVSLLFFAQALVAVPCVIAAERWELGFEGGFVAVDEDLSGPDHRALEPALGGRAGFAFSKRWALFGDGLYSAFATDTFRQDARVVSLRGGIDLYFTPDRDPRWFLNAAVGYMDIAFDNASDFYSGFVSGGFGQHVWLSGRKSIRWELRVDHTLAEEGLTGEDITQAQFLIGLSWGPHRRRDSDGDGFPDRRDRCPSSPAGRAVDEYGCSIPQPQTAPASPVVPAAPLPDSDADGVNDENDRCPDTLAGIEVDEHGCPLDRDGDGVYDGLGMDKCPDTPQGATVNAHGCPRDSDDDGVLDGLDRCPDTGPGDSVGSDGCPPESGPS